MSKISSKIVKFFLIGNFCFLSMVLSLVNIVYAQQPSGSRLSGRILLQVEEKGEAWYVRPDNLQRYYLGRPRDAFNLMRELGLGISEKDYNTFAKNNNQAPSRLGGKILLRVEKRGEAYYVIPSSWEMKYLGKPSDAFEIMRKEGLGITNKDLEKIKIGEPSSETIKNVTEPSSNNSNPDYGVMNSSQEICKYESGCEEYEGVKIKWVVDETTFPPEWMADKERIDPSAESLTDKDDIERSIKILKKAMDKYPKYFFRDKKNGINAIYIVEHLHTFHEFTVGTLSVPDKKLYLSSAKDTEDEVFEQFFHHEYAHLLYWQNYDLFSEEEWDKINPDGFKYDRAKGAEWGGIDEESNRENGFLENYSKTAREEDFSLLAQKLFKDNSNSLDNIWNLKERYPRIHQKIDLMIKFYYRLDPTFVEEYFRRVSNE